MSDLSSPQHIEATLSPPSHKISGSLSSPRNLNANLQRGPYGVPSINGVPLVGDISLPQLGLRGIYCDRTENWNAQIDFIGRDGAIYIYSDYSTEKDGAGGTVNVPSIKIGDGSTPLIDRPFVAAQFAEAVTDIVSESVIAKLNDDRMIVTQEDREKWDRKVTCLLDPDNYGNIIFSY